jgi:hypothetical protein
MDTLAAISRWLGKQHVISWCVASEESCGAPMRSMCMTRKTSPSIS